MTRYLALLPAIALAAAPVASTAAAPGGMTAAEFLAKADGLKAKGPMALFSGDIGKLKAEGTAAGQAYKARLRADKAAGRSPHSCPPASASLTPRQLLAHLRTYSPAEQASTTMTSAVADYFAKIYPCR
jgi:hypothetical protein